MNYGVDKEGSEKHLPFYVHCGMVIIFKNNECIADDLELYFQLIVILSFQYFLGKKNKMKPSKQAKLFAAEMNLSDFLSQSERKTAQKRVYEIFGKINLPVSSSQLSKYLLQCNSTESDQLLMNSYINYELNKLNRTALDQQFISIAEEIMELFSNYLHQFVDGGAQLDAFYKEITQMMQKRYKNSQFSIQRESNPYQKKKDATKCDDFYDQVESIMSQVINMLKGIYQIEDEENFQMLLSPVLERFVEDNQQFMEIIHKMPCKYEDEAYHSEKQLEMVQMIKQITQMEESDDGFKKQPQKQVVKEKENGKPGYLKYLAKIPGIIKGAGIFVMEKGQKSVGEIISKSYQKYREIAPMKVNQNPLSQIPIQDEKYQKFIDNLKINQSLVENQEYYIQSILKSDKEDPDFFDYKFTYGELNQICECLFQPLNEWNNKEILTKQVGKQLEYVASKIMEIIQEFKTEEVEGRYNGEQKAQFLVHLIRYIYYILKDNYTNAIRKYFHRFCKALSKKFKHIHMYFIGALKIIESDKLKRSEFLQILSQQRPYRQTNNDYVVSQRSRIYSDRIKYLSREDANLYTQKELMRIRNSFPFKNGNIPKLEIVKLTHSQARKTITLLISGFLSQDTNKHEEWIGLLKAMEDSEVYAVCWESGTVSEMLKYTVETARDLFFGRVTAKVVGGPMAAAIAIAHQLYVKYATNPFLPALQNAKLTGEYLAELIISNFDGHLVNLVGFSLGTQVIRATIQRLIQRNRIDLINRVVTLGGVADKFQIERLLKQSNTPLDWMNLHSKYDYVIKFLLKVCLPSSTPIGANTISDLSGHQIQNLECSDFINGHLAYRNNMFAIAKMIGLRDD